LEAKKKSKEHSDPRDSDHFLHVDTAAQTFHFGVRLPFDFYF